MPITDFSVALGLNSSVLAILPFVSVRGAVLNHLIILAKTAVFIVLFVLFYGKAIFL